MKITAYMTDHHDVKENERGKDIPKDVARARATRTTCAQDRIREEEETRESAAGKERSTRSTEHNHTNKHGLEDDGHDEGANGRDDDRDVQALYTLEGG